MMRLFPHSLFGRMVLVLLAGLILAQVLSTAISLYERRNFISQNIRAESAQRIAEIVNLLDSFDPAERDKLTRVLNTRHLQVSLKTPPLAEEKVESNQDDYATGFASSLRSYLGQERSITVAPARPPAAMPTVQVRLHDGTWVTFAHTPPIRFSVPYGLLLNLLVLLVAVIVILLIVVRWVTRPLSVLALAAEELGNNINRPPLVETGPLEVRRAASAFNRMQARLVHYLQDRTRILAAMSHDLKTPITRLRLRTELLHDVELKAKFNKDLKEMEAMVSATLEFMRGVDKRELAQPVDMMALLESIQADAEELGQEVKIEGSAQRPYSGEPQALQRCITNLVDNAVKYGKRATIIINDDNTNLRILIRDAGPGIPEDQLEQVMEPFYRLEASRSRETGGTGLGLTIARSIAEAHGGKLHLQNAADGGLEAVLTLPRSNSTLPRSNRTI